MQAAGISTTSMVTNPTWKVGIWWQGHPGLFTVDSPPQIFDSPQQWWWGPSPMCRQNPWSSPLWISKWSGILCGAVDGFLGPCLEALASFENSFQHKHPSPTSTFPNTFPNGFEWIHSPLSSSQLQMDFCWISVAQDLSVNFCFHQLAWISENMSIVLLIKSIKMEQKYKSPP